MDDRSAHDDLGAGEAAAPLPAGFCCIACGYDVSSTRARVGEACVECGRAVESADLGLWASSARLLARGGAIRRASIVWWVVTVTVCSLVLLMLSWVEAVVGFAVLSGSVGWSVVVGWAQAMCGPRHLRELSFSVWLMHLWRLHVSWLWGGPVMGVLLVVIGSVWGDEGVQYGGAVLALAGVPAVLRGVNTWEGRVRRAPGVSRGAMLGAGLAVVLPNLLVGVWAGVESSRVVSVVLR